MPSLVACAWHLENPRRFKRKSRKGAAEARHPLKSSRSCRLSFRAASKSSKWDSCFSGTWINPSSAAVKALVCSDSGRNLPFFPGSKVMAITFAVQIHFAHLSFRTFLNPVFKSNHLFPCWPLNDSTTVFSVPFSGCRKRRRNSLAVSASPGKNMKPLAK